MRLATGARDSPAIYRDSDDSGICLSACFLFPPFLPRVCVRVFVRSFVVVSFRLLRS